MVPVILLCAKPIHWPEALTDLPWKLVGGDNDQFFGVF